MKIVIMGNQARAMANFWTVLVRLLQDAGCEVLCLAPDENPAWNEDLRALGVRLEHFPLDRKGLNPVADLSTLAALYALLRRERPEVLFTSTIKPVIYGNLASALAGGTARQGRIAAITGLGYMFEADSFVKKRLRDVARLLYRAAFSFCGTVIFQNRDDEALFRDLSIVPNGIRTAFTCGTGVDLAKYMPEALPPEPFTFLLIGRLLEAKGLREFSRAAASLKKRYPNARFRILGPAEHGVGSVPVEEVLSWQDKGVLEYLGETTDVRPFIRDSHVLVLPSYREGLPTVVMEAAAMGRAAIVADAPGCREAVRPGETGLFCTPRDARTLEQAMERLLREPGLAARMGQAARQEAEARFDARKVAAHIAALMGIGV